ncbi:MAG: class IV adenylate cyclase [Acidobacteria bacterium]|nr:class IV adenylate cyclase [Acidobacteriota bacterium]
MGHPPLETELKIPVPGLEPVRAALRGLKAEKVHHMAREVNVLLDTEDDRLQTSGRALRLRRYGDRHLFTLKGPVSYRGTIKVRQENEVEVEDVERLQTILEDLGFSTVVRYEKDRETWRIGRIIIVLDHTPMGDFVEVEGPPEEIEATASAIGLDPERAVRGSYLSLWQVHRQRHPEDHLPADMVFPK